MSGNSPIEWTDKTWNPVVGCTRVSAGCDHCYAFQLHDQRYLAYKRGRWPAAPAQYYQPFSRVQLLRERLRDPLRWRTPHLVFVNSMADLFHDAVTDQFIAEVFGIMAMTPQHTYQVLTKRPERMLDWVRSHTHEQCAAWATGYLGDVKPRTFRRAVERIGAGWPWPLPNVWLGVSVEHQAAAAERIPLLLETPAAVRFLSCEPLLGPLDLREYIQLTDSNVWGWGNDDDDGGRAWGYEPYGGGFQSLSEYHDIEDAQPGIRWIIAGGESGRFARPMDLLWEDSIIEQCRDAGIACFVKQLGSVYAKTHGCHDAHAGDIAEWPEHLRVREWPVTAAGSEAAQ